jgi:hypothetical protein
MIRSIGLAVHGRKHDSRPLILGRELGSARQVFECWAPTTVRGRIRGRNSPSEQ